MDNNIPVLERMSAYGHSTDLMVMLKLRKNMKIPSSGEFGNRRFWKVLLWARWHLGRSVSEARPYMHPCFLKLQ